MTLEVRMPRGRWIGLIGLVTIGFAYEGLLECSRRLRLRPFSRVAEASKW